MKKCFLMFLLFVFVSVTSVYANSWHSVTLRITGNGSSFLKEYRATGYGGLNHYEAQAVAISQAQSEHPGYSISVEFCD